MNTDKNQLNLEELDASHPLRQLPFTTPDGYFDALPGRIQSRVTAQKRPGISISWSWQRTGASLAAASLIAVLVWQTLPQRQESLGAEALTGVSDAAIMAYLEDEGVSADDIADPAMMQTPFASDSTAVQYLDIQPADIEEHIDREGLSETTDFGS
jgi:hypothetical protein